MFELYPSDKNTHDPDEHKDSKKYRESGFKPPAFNHPTMQKVVYIESRIPTGMDQKEEVGSGICEEGEGESSQILSEEEELGSHLVSQAAGTESKESSQLLLSNEGDKPRMDKEEISDGPGMETCESGEMAYYCSDLT